MLKALAYSLYPRGSVRRVLRGSRRGCRFVVRDAMGVCFALGLTDDDAFVTRFKDLIPSGSQVLDVGANRGQLALLFARIVGPAGRVVSVEPMPELVADLTRNCELNNFKNVSVVCAAAAESIGEAKFAFPEHSQTRGKLLDVERTYTHEVARELKVKTTTVDQLVREYSISPVFMKVDVEGAGAVVLRGAQETIRRYRPVVWLELHGPKVDFPADLTKRADFDAQST